MSVGIERHQRENEHEPARLRELAWKIQAARLFDGELDRLASIEVDPGNSEIWIERDGVDGDRDRGD